jgi:chromosome segregation ATPase
LETYDEDVVQIESALAALMEKDRKIGSLSTTILELKRSNTEEVRGLQEQVDKLSESQRQLKKQENTLKQQENALKDSKQKLEDDKQEEEVRREKFRKDQQARCDKNFLIEKDKLKKETAKQILEHDKVASAKFQRAEQEIAQLRNQVQELTEGKERINKTLGLYMKESRELESQVEELQYKYPIQKVPTKQ